MPRVQNVELHDIYEQGRTVHSVCVCLGMCVYVYVGMCVCMFSFVYICLSRPLSV